MKKWYGRTDEFVMNDLTISHLGYWTDNGTSEIDKSKSFFFH
jgi:hypothetical protein